MEEQGTRTPAQAGTAGNGEDNPGLASLPGANWPDWRWLVLLVLLAAGLRTWQVRHTEVPSRDTIGYIRIAWYLEHADWLWVIRGAPQHPGYPAALLAASLPLRRLAGGDLVWAMQFSAQLVSALASVLLVVPMYYLGRELFDRRVGFWASALFQCLPASSRVMGDGLSESLFLLWATAGLLFAVRALRTRSRIGFGLCGLCTGLAYLTRPEGAMVGMAAGLVLLGMQTIKGWRRPWRECLLSGAVLAGTALVLAGPYMLVIKGVTVKTTGRRLLHEDEGRFPPGAVGTEAQTRVGSAGPALLAVWDPGAMARGGWALYALGVELNKGFFYLGWPLALLGLWWFRDRFRLVPGAWVLLTVCVLLGLLLYLVALVMGYMSDRHALLILLCAGYWAVAAVGAAGPLLGRWLGRCWPQLAGTRWADGRTWSLALLLGLCGGPLPRTLEPLHPERAGFRRAGYWLAEHVRPDEGIIDPYCWANYYAGSIFVGEHLVWPGREPSVYYVVLDESRSLHPHLLGVEYAQTMAAGGTVAAVFPVHHGKYRAEVRIIVVRRRG